MDTRMSMHEAGHTTITYNAVPYGAYDVNNYIGYFMT
jgi:hypothetical protein